MSLSGSAFRERQRKLKAERSQWFASREIELKGRKYFVTIPEKGETLIDGEPLHKWSSSIYPEDREIADEVRALQDLGIHVLRKSGWEINII